MKPTLVSIFAALAVAQDFGGQPSCAVPCLTSAITGAGCELSDVACQCGPTQAAIGAAAAGCLVGACNAVDLASAQSAGSAACSSYSAALSSMASSTQPPTGTASGTISITMPPSTSSYGYNSTATDHSHESSADHTHGSSVTPSPTSGSAGAGQTTTSAPTAAAAIVSPVMIGCAVVGFVGLMAAL